MGHRNSSWSRKLIMPGASLRVPDVVLTGSAHSEGHRGHRPPEPDPRHACPLHRTHNGMKPQKATSELQRWARHKKGLPYMQESAVLPLGPQAGSGGYPGSAIRPWLRRKLGRRLCCAGSPACGVTGRGGLALYKGQGPRVHPFPARGSFPRVPLHRPTATRAL